MRMIRKGGCRDNEMVTHKILWRRYGVEENSEGGECGILEMDPRGQDKKRRRHNQDVEQAYDYPHDGVKKKGFEISMEERVRERQKNKNKQRHIQNPVKHRLCASQLPPTTVFLVQSVFWIEITFSHYVTSFIADR